MRCNRCNVNQATRTFKVPKGENVVLERHQQPGEELYVCRTCSYELCLWYDGRAPNTRVLITLDATDSRTEILSRALQLVRAGFAPEVERGSLVVRAEDIGPPTGQDGEPYTALGTWGCNRADLDYVLIMFDAIHKARPSFEYEYFRGAQDAPEE